MSRFHLRPLLVLAFVSSAAAAACSETCDRTGCDAGEEPAGGVAIGRGIAGVAFSQSDVVANGCQTCPLGEGSLSIWTAAGPVDSHDAAVALIQSAEPDVEVEIDGEYERELAAGDYLVCNLPNDSDGECAAVHVADGEVTTVHAKHAFGPASVIVFDPGEDDPRTTGIFGIGPGDLP
jgi:hypothetical protein